MKKLIAILLCLVMIFSLCACNASGIPVGMVGVFREFFRFSKTTNVNVTVQVPVAVSGISRAAHLS